MANTINYVEQFRQQPEQKYARKLVSSDLRDQGVKFVGIKTVKIPRLTVVGYNEHAGTGGWKRKDLSNEWEFKNIPHDRDVEFYVDAMDVDETNPVVSVANKKAAPPNTSLHLIFWTGAQDAPNTGGKLTHKGHI